MGLILRSKPSAVFMFLKSREQAHLSEIAKETGASYVHIAKLVSKFREQGLATIQPEGRKKVVRLTGKGKEIASLVEEIRRRSE